MSQCDSFNFLKRNLFVFKFTSSLSCGRPNSKLDKIASQAMDGEIISILYHSMPFCCLPLNSGYRTPYLLSEKFEL